MKRSGGLAEVVVVRDQELFGVTLNNKHPLPLPTTISCVSCTCLLCAQILPAHYLAFWVRKRWKNGDMHRTAFRAWRNHVKGKSPKKPRQTMDH